MDITLEKVEESKKNVLYRLLQYSLFEESLSDQNDMNEDALFEYPWFENYFTEEGRDACFIRERGTGRLLGFVMINTYVRKWDSGHSIAEFLSSIPIRQKWCAGFMRNILTAKAFCRSSAGSKRTEFQTVPVIRSGTSRI